MKRVFIGGTYDDLIDHRKNVIEAFGKWNSHIIVDHMMNFQPGVVSKDECLQRVKDSDVYVLVIGSRYGSIDKSSGKSYTHLEYETAISNNLIIVPFIIHDEAVVQLKFVDTGVNASKLAKFKKQVQNDFQTSTYYTAYDLPGMVVSAVIHHLFGKSLLGSSIYDDVNKPIKSNPLKTLKIPTGISFFGQSDLDIDFSGLLLEKDRTYQISDAAFETACAAAFIAINLRNGAFDFLNDIVSFSPDVWKLLSVMIMKMGVNDQALSNSIRLETNLFKLRLLIYIAGAAKSEICVESICIRLYDFKEMQESINQYNFQIAPFKDVIKNSLHAMPRSTDTIIDKHIERARKYKRWPVKKILHDAKDKDKPILGDVYIHQRL